MIFYGFVKETYRNNPPVSNPNKDRWVLERHDFKTNQKHDVLTHGVIQLYNIHISHTPFMRGLQDETLRVEKLMLVYPKRMEWFKSR